MTHIAERSTVDPPCHPHPSLADMLARPACDNPEAWCRAEVATRRRQRAVEGVQALYECAIQWMPWSLTRGDIEGYRESLRADRDAAIQAIQGRG